MIDFWYSFDNVSSDNVQLPVFILEKLVTQ